LFQSVVGKSELVEEFVNGFLNTDPGFRESIITSMLKGEGVIDEIKTLEESKITKLLIHAKDDSLVNVEYIRKIGAITNSEVKIINGGHYLPIDNSNGMIETLKTFLEKVN